jgi:DNA replication and repair protein RecF
MPIESISISRFRNLQPAELLLSPGLNLITGANAAGKTSLLEAFFVLARGRSFRTTQLDQLIQSGHSDFQIVVMFLTPEGRRIPVGIQRSQGRFECRINGRASKRLSELAALFPVQWMGGNLHTLVEDGPAYRRQFLDWGLFHVKPDYIVLWKRFNKLLKQRNAALRTGAGRRAIEAWNPELADAGERLHASRQDYLKKLLSVFVDINPEFPTLREPVAIGYRKGWRSEGSYLDVLNESLASDMESRFTRAGPQRGELSFTVAGKPATEQLSRGQQKVFITALQVAQAKLLQQETGKSSLFLLDDLGAELDAQNQLATLRLLSDIHAQVFVSTIEEPPLTGIEQDHIRRFHVKHGAVSEVV